MPISKRDRPLNPLVTRTSVSPFLHSHGSFS
jgi:hypothetical protein